MSPRCPHWHATWLPLLTLAFVSSGSVGCGAYYSYAPLSAPRHPLTSRAPADVQVTVLKPPSQEFEALGILQVNAGMQDVTSVQLIDMLHACAARVGCDGLYVTEVEPWGGPHRSPYVRGVCITYPSSVPPAASPPATSPASTSSPFAPAQAPTVNSPARDHECSPQMAQPRVPLPEPRVPARSGGSATPREGVLR